MLDLVEQTLDQLLSAAETRPAMLSQAMRWAVEGGGKRIRPQICLAAAMAAGGKAEDALLPACAIELLHSYTLVHDDLPAMDNDVTRRGKPSVWAKYGEATAVLTGDQLQALAFATAARTPHNAAEVTAALGRAALAVVAGQVADLAAGSGAVATEAQLVHIFANKTAALFVAAAEMGTLAAGAESVHMAQLADYARNLGFAFQYEDDLLDGEDGAFSSLALLGRDEVMRRVEHHTAAAQAALEGLPGPTGFLFDLAARLVRRTA